MICLVGGCGRDAYARHLCNAHYRRMRRTGHPLGREWIGRKLAKIDRRGQAECWPWTGAKTSGGYGSVGHDRRHMSAHVLAYEHWVGPVPEGKQLDHLCRNRACCNPAHLEPVTVSENVRRGRKYLVPPTECKRGHPFTPENTYTAPNGRRQCTACQRQRERDYRRRRRGTSHNHMAAVSLSDGP